MAVPRISREIKMLFVVLALLGFLAVSVAVSAEPALVSPPNSAGYNSPINEHQSAVNSMAVPKGVPVEPAMAAAASTLASAALFDPPPPITPTDGFLLVTGIVTFTVERTTSSFYTPAGSHAITVSNSSDFTVGHEILIINMQGSGLGTHETAIVSAVATNVLTLTDSLEHEYDGTTDKIMVQRVPYYSGVKVENGGTLTVDAWDGETGGMIFFRAVTATVEDGGSIDVNGLGFGSASGPGGGESGSSTRGGGGGGYGGWGGNGDDGDYGGTPYGSVYQPTDLGSGGGKGNGLPGGAGGGSVWLVVSDTLAVSGTVTASGLPGITGTTDASGGGSGGSIWIEAGTFKGGGNMSAGGGNGYRNYWQHAYGGGGAGGRVAVYAQTFNFTGHISTTGGTGYVAGGPGTIYLMEGNSSISGTLIIRNGQNDGQSAGLLPGVYEFDRIDLTQFGHLVVISDTSVLTLSNGVLAGDGTARLTGEGVLATPSSFEIVSTTLVVKGDLIGTEIITTIGGGGLELHGFAPPWHAGVYTFTKVFIGDDTALRLVPLENGDSNYEDDKALELRVGNLSVAPLGVVSADGLGYGSASGPGAGQSSGSPTQSGGGGGHGSAGGRGEESLGGNSYGSAYLPVDLGSGGGKDGSTPGGAGGGAIRLVISSNLTLSGTLTANGDPGKTGGANGVESSGGGSGGSIWIQAGMFSGNGEVLANGGNGYLSNGRHAHGGGGAGGRIAIYAQTSTFSGTIKVLGGTGYQSGKVGTVYLGLVDPVSSTVVAQPETNLIADGERASTITVTLVTTNSVPVSDTLVSLQVEEGTNCIINSIPVEQGVLTQIGLTDSSGTVTAKLASTQLGAKILRTWAGQVPLVNTAAVTFTAGLPDGQRSWVEAEPEVVAADGLTTATLHVQVYDVYTNPVPGVPVTLTHDGGPDVMIDPQVSLTDDGGETWGTIRSATPQAVTVTAIADGVPIVETVEVTFVGADLTVAKSGPEEQLAGRALTYTLEIENQGLLSAQNVILTDTLPHSMTFVTQTSPYTFTIDGSILVWQLGTLSPSQAAQFLVQAMISPTAPVGEGLANQVEVRTDAPEGDLENNVATWTTTVARPTPKMIVSPIVPTLDVSQGITASLVVTISNSGTGVLTDVHATAPLYTPWISLDRTTFPDLEPGQSVTCIVTADPLHGLITGEYRDRIWVHGHGISPRPVALTTRLLGPVRALQLTVSNTEGAVVGGALVQMQREESSVQVTEGVTVTYHRTAQGATGAQGSILLAGLLTGTYDYLVQADHHLPLTGELTIVSGAGSQSEPLLLSALPHLTVEPATITVTVTRGREAIREVYVRNDGAAPLHGVMVTTPLQTPPWLHFGLPDSTDVISAGARVPILIYATPTVSDEQDYYQDYLEIGSHDGGSAALAVGVALTDYQTRTVLFEVRNTPTATLENATVLLARQEPNLLVSRGITELFTSTVSADTDAAGLARFESMPAGAYNYQVSAMSHAMVTGTLEVEPGPTPLTVTAELFYYPITYDWTVLPTPITDTYQVTLSLTYDTRSPAPILFITGEDIIREECGWQGHIAPTFHIENPTLITQEVYMIDKTEVGVVVWPKDSAEITVGNIWAHCGLNAPLTVVHYAKTQNGPTYTVIPTALDSPVLSPTQKFGQIYELKVILPFVPAVLLDIGKAENLSWITITNPYSGWPIAPQMYDSLYLTLTATAPEWLPEGIYTETIPIRLLSPDSERRVIKESYLHIVATQSDEGLVLHVAFDAGNLLTESATYYTYAPFNVRCGCSPGDPGWAIGGPWDGPAFAIIGPYGFPRPPLPWVPDPDFGYDHQQVRLQISQDVLLEREAFQATLALTNTQSQALQDMQVAIIISDAQGTGVVEHFAITPTTPTDIGDIPAWSNRRVRWTLVPGDLHIEDANGAKYYVSAVMSYTIGTTPHVVKTLAREILVKPTPLLELHYYVPGPDAICTEFPLYVEVTNWGYGWARDLRVASAQPRIAENPSGLLINFKIVGAALGDRPVPNGLFRIDFGDLAPGYPGEMKKGSWLLRTDLPGSFVEFFADFKNKNALGLPISSLIKEVNTDIISPGLAGYERLNRNQESIFLAAQTTARAGRGVNTFSGYFSENSLDFSIPTRGLPLKFERAYNSAASTDKGSLGYGWSHNYEMRLELDFVGNATLVSGRGAQMQFMAATGGTYFPAPGVRANLAQGPTGVFTLTLVNQVRYTFDSSGKLLAEVDANGNANTMLYDGARLVGVRAPDGRELRFEYDEQNRITTVQDPLSRTIRFGYDSQDQLTSITDVRDFTTTLTYISEHRLAKIVDANDHTVILNIYDDRGRVIEQENGLGESTKFHYEVEDCTLGRTTTITNTRGFPRVDYYAIRGELSRQEDALGHVISYTYDLNFNVAAIKDKNGHTTRYQSDVRGNPLRVTDPLSNTTISTYDTHYNLVSQVDALSRTTTYDYDNRDNLITTTNPLQGRIVNTYDEHGQLVKTVDQNGHPTWYVYDELGNRTVITDSLGNATRTEYDLAGRPITVTDALGRETVYTYDAAGNVLVTDIEGNRTVQAYDKVGNLLTVEDANGHSTSFSYDAVNQIITVTDALSGTTGYSYDPMGNRTAITDARRHSTYFAYDPLDRLITTTNALGGETVNAYDPVGNVTAVTDANDHTTHYAYDALDRLITTTNALSGQAVNSYDAVGNIVARTDANEHTTYYAYDVLNRLITTTNALDGQTVNAYDPMGNVTAATDANGHTTRYEYDALNRLITTTDALSGTVIVGYDRVGNKTRLTDANDHTTHYAYDELNRLITATNALSGTIIVGYDRVGNRTRLIDANGDPTYYEYDALNRLITITNSLGGTTIAGYDQVGNKMRITDANANTTYYAYDAVNRLITTTNALGGETVNAYDPVGNVTAVTDANDRTTYYAYDALNRLTTTTDALSGQAVNFYDAVGNVVAKTDANEHATSYAYDALNRLITTTNALDGQTVNAYDPAGNVTAATDANGHTTHYEYDALNRLITVTDALSGTLGYGYDPAGNRVHATDANEHSTYYGYDALNRVITITNPLQGETINIYDGIGNLVRQVDAEGRVTHYAYDPLGRLRVMTDTLGYTTTYAYDALGNRTVITDAEGYSTHASYDGLNRVTAITDALGGATSFGYDGLDHVTWQRDAEGRLTTYEYDALNRLVTTTNQLEGKTINAYDPAGNQVVVTDTRGYRTSYEYDDLNRLTLITDPLTGTTVYDYDAVGNRTGARNARQYWTLYDYDALNRLITTTNTLNGKTVNMYDAVGNLVRQVDAEENATLYGYDSLDRVTVMTDALLYTTTYTYDGVGNLTAATDANHHTTYYDYDSLNRVLSVTDPLSFTVRYAYDRVGNRTVMTDATDYATRYEYDGLGRLALLRDPLSHLTRYGYDRVGNRTTITDALGIVTRNDYDGLNRMIRVVENYRPGEPLSPSVNVETEYGYDEAGNRITITDTNGHVTRFAYDPLNRLIQTTDPLTYTHHFVYDATGNLIGRTDANTATTTFVYDGLDRLVQITYPEQIVSFAYDHVGNRTAMTDGLGVTSYAYDDLYRLVHVSDPYTGTVAYRYDPVGNRAGITYPSGQVVTDTYDAANRLTMMLDWDDGQTQYEYDKAGRVLTITLPNGIVTSQTYDAAGRLIQIEHADGSGKLLARYTYRLNDVGSRVAVTEEVRYPVEGMVSLPSGLAQAKVDPLSTGSPAEMKLPQAVTALQSRLAKARATSALPGSSRPDNRAMATGGQPSLVASLGQVVPDVGWSPAGRIPEILPFTPTISMPKAGQIRIEKQASVQSAMPITFTMVIDHQLDRSQRTTATGKPEADRVKVGLESSGRLAPSMPVFHEQVGSTPTPTATMTPTATPSAEPTATPTATLPPTPTITPTSIPSPTPTMTPVPTVATPSPSPTPTAMPTLTPTPLPTWTPSPTPTVTPSPTASPTPTPTVEPGVPVKAIVRLEQVTLPADGASQARIAVLLVDEQGNPVLDGTRVFLEAEGGQVSPAEAQTSGGLVFARLRAGSQPGPGQLDVRAGDVSASTSFELVPLAEGEARLDDGSLPTDAPLPFDLQEVVERARNQVQIPARGLPFVERPGHRAVFDAGSLQLAPRGGSGLPDLITTTVELAGVYLGGQPLFEGPAPAVPDIGGNAVRFERGPGLVEEYLARDGGIEQRLRIEQDPGLPGDLTMAVEVQTPLDLALAEGGDGFVFRWIGPRGARMAPVASYGRALALDAGGRAKRATLNAEELAPVLPGLRRYRLEMTFPEDWLADAQYPVVIDPLIGGLLQMDVTLGTQSTPAVAYNSTDGKYLVVWQDNRSGNYDIYGQLVGADGLLVGQNLAIRAASGDQTLPDVAYNPGSDTYLVTWRSGTAAIHAQRVDATGSLVGGLLDLAGMLQTTADRPAVAYSSSADYWLVTWQQWQGSTNENDVRARAVSNTGTMATAFTVYSNTGDDTAPDVAANDTQGFLVAWEREGAGTSIYARRTTATGVDGNAFAVTDAIVARVAPKLTYNADDDQYLAAWQDLGAGYDTVWGRRVRGQYDPSGQFVDDAFQVSDAGQADCGAPAVTYLAPSGGDNGHYLVAWEQGAGAIDLYARWVLTDGTPSGSFTLSDVGSRHYDVALAAGPSMTTILAAWTDGRAGNMDVYARSVVAGGDLGEETVVHPAPGDQQLPQAAYNPDDDEYLVVWQDYRQGTTNPDIYGQRVTSEGVPVGENIAVNTASYRQIAPRVAYATEGKVYLVVWCHYPGTADDAYDVYGQRLSRTGQLQGSPLVIANESGTTGQEYPTDVVYNSTSDRFLVLWDDMAATKYWDVWGRHVSTDGSLGDVVQITTLSGYHEDSGAGAYDPDDDQYLITWKYRAVANGAGDIQGRRMTGSGTVNPETLNIATGMAEQQYPDVAHLAGVERYVVVWEDNHNGSYDVYGQLVSPAGALDGDNYAVTSASQNDRSPRLAMDGSGGGLVAWQRDDGGSAANELYGRWLGGDGRPTGDGFTLLAAGGEQQRPAVATNGTGGYFLAWQDNRNSNWDVYGSLYEPLRAGFGATPRVGITPLSVEFTDGSVPAGAADAWRYAFGDGGTSVAQNPVYTYTQGGVYTVTQWVTDTAMGEAAVLTRTHYVTVYQAVEAGFTAVPTGGPAPLTVAFTNTSTGDYDASLWRFGDGVTGTLESLTHTYTVPDVYTVALTVNGLGGSDTLTRTHYITAYTPVHADFSAWPTYGIAPLFVVLTDTSTGDYVSRLWKFGDGITSTLPGPAHVYAAGAYTVALTVSGPGGTDTLTRTAYITSVADLVTTTIDYVYDPLGRLISATYSTGEVYTYTYDAAGNRLEMGAAGEVTMYTHDAANRLTSVGGVGYTYDHNGNLLSDGARTFVYDTANRLKQVANGTFTTTYTYAGDGTRLAQTINGAITRYVVDLSGELPQVLEERRAGHVTRYLHGPGGAALEADGVWTYHLADALGSVRQAADAAGDVTLAQSYAPFGEPLTSVGQPAGSFGFAGEQRDAAAGLVYLRNRYYDPATGRFLTRDVYPALATVPQSLHAYVYCGNDPVNRTDPSGQWWWDDWADTIKQGWNGFTQWSYDAEDWLETRWTSTKRTITNWQTDPRRETAKALTTFGKSVTDYSLRKRAELTKDVRAITKAWEEGDKDVAIGQGTVYMLHLAGLTDVRLTRNIIAGQAIRINESVQQFNRYHALAIDPRTAIGSSKWFRAMGEMTFAAFDLTLKGAPGDIRYGMQDGDYLRAAAGVVQIIPGAGWAGNSLDLAVAGRETYRGLRSGDAAQVEMGLFGMMVNAGQLRSGGADPVSALERPVESVRWSHLASDVTGRAVGSIVPGGELLVEGGRQAAGTVGEIGRRAAGAIWESVNDQRLYAVGPSTQRWLGIGEGAGDIGPTNRALVPDDAEFAARQQFSPPTQQSFNGPQTRNRTAYLLGGGVGTPFAPDHLAADQVLEMSRHYSDVYVNDRVQEYLDYLRQHLEQRGGVPYNVHIEPAADAASVGRQGRTDIFVIAPNLDWMLQPPFRQRAALGLPSSRSLLAETLDKVVGEGSRAYVFSEFDSIADLQRFLRKYEWRECAEARPYKKGMRIGGVIVDSPYFYDLGTKTPKDDFDSLVRWITLGR